MSSTASGRESHAVTAVTTTSTASSLPNMYTMFPLHLYHPSPQQPPPPPLLHHVLLLDDAEIEKGVTPPNGSSHHPVVCDSSTTTPAEARQSDPKLDTSVTASSNHHHPSKKRRLLRLDRSLQHDYLAKRYRAFCELHHLWSMQQQPQQQQQQQQITTTATTPATHQKKTNRPPNSTNGGHNSNLKKEEWMKNVYRTHPPRHDYNGVVDDDNDEATFWHGATPLERALVACCCGAPFAPPRHYPDPCTDAAKATDDTTKSKTRNPPEDHSNRYPHHGSGTSTSTTASVPHQPGVLVREHIPHFVGLVAMHCHSVASRALVLAILQVTLEVDDEDREQEEERLQLYHEDDYTQNEETKDSHNDENDNSIEINKDTTPSTPPKSSTCDTDQNSNAIDNVVVVERMSPKFVHPRSEILPARIKMFMQAGGLLLLARWFKESTTLEKVLVVEAIPNQKKSKPTKNGGSLPKKKSKMITSSTGKLLLPMIEFLQRIPFDGDTRKLIRQSKMNVGVLALRKQLKEIVDSWVDAAAESSVTVDGGNGGDTESAATMDPSVSMKTDPKSGGLPVMKVWTGINQLCDIWKAKHDQIKSKQSNQQPEIKYKTVPEPFANILSEIDDRLQVLRQYEGVDSRIASDAEPLSILNAPKLEKPEWLRNNIQQRKMKRQKLSNERVTVTTANNRKLSVQERALLELKKKDRMEMDERNKLELEEIRREKAEILRKQREKEAVRLRQQQQQQQSSTTPTGGDDTLRTTFVSTKPSVSKVKWKDGLTGISSNVRKHLLEQVFEYTPDTNVWTEPKSGTYNPAARQRSGNINVTMEMSDEHHHKEAYHFHTEENLEDDDDDDDHANYNNDDEAQSPYNGDNVIEVLDNDDEDPEEE